MYRMMKISLALRRCAIVAVAILLGTGSLARSAAIAAEPAQLFVHADGNDAHSGRKVKADAGESNGPFRTVQRALEAARELRKSGQLDQPVRITLLSDLTLSEPLVLTPEDSGTASSPTILESAGERVAVLSGGYRVPDWKVEGDRWTATLPKQEGGWNPRHITVNGEWRERPRLPAEGTYTIAGFAGADPRAKYNTPANRFEYAAGEIDPNWKNLNDVEAVVLHFWVDTHLKIKEIDADKRIVTFDRFSKRKLTDDHQPKPARYYLTNVFEALAPGQFYFDRQTDTLHYMPRAGETPENTVVVVPRLTTLVELRGEPRRGRFVEHVQLSRLAFEHTSWEPKPDDAVDGQAASQVSGAVVMVGARNCELADCAIRNVGGYAVELRDGCQRVSLARNAIEWIGAGGVKMSGGVANSPEELRTSGNEIVDNRLLHLGRTWHSGVGILSQHAAGNRIAHNEIGDLYYTGISVGWVWGYAPSVSRDNVVEFNHIHDVGQKLLSDMGGVYLLGTSPGTVVRNNLIHDIAAHGYGGWGLYTDEGSTGITLENNVVYRTTDAGFHQHYGKENVIRNNIFAFGRDEQVARSRMEPHLSFTFERNIVYFNEGELLSKNWSDDKFAIDFNVYWNAAGKPLVFPGGKTFDEWRERGFDKHSIVADPAFVDANAGDFTLKADSPALKLGFKPIDLRNVGPRKPAGEGKR